MDKAQWLSAELYKLEITSPLDPPEDVLASWDFFASELVIVGGVLDTFVEDEEAAVTVRDRLICWSRIWARFHPEPEYRPFYGAVAIAAERGDWNFVSKLCQALIREEEQHET
jgi:hypothetical protein